MRTFFNIVIFVIFFINCQENHFSKFPYLQGGNDNQIMIIWETSEEADSKIEYNLLDGSVATVSNKNQTTFHKIILNPLDLASSYEYRAISDSLDTDKAIFQTVPSNNNFIFGLIGERHSMWIDD